MASRKKVDPGIAKVTLKLKPPGEDEWFDIEVDIANFTLHEWAKAKKAAALLTNPDAMELAAINAWIVWRRDHPQIDLEDWFDGIKFGDLLGINFEDAAVMPPEGYDPEVFGDG